MEYNGNIMEYNRNRTFPKTLVLFYYKNKNTSKIRTRILKLCLNFIYRLDKVLQVNKIFCNR